MRYLSVAIAASLTACTAVPVNKQAASGGSVLPPGSKRLIAAGTDSFSEYWVDYDSIYQRPPGDLLHYTIYARAKPQVHAHISIADVIADCKKQNRLETVIVMTDASGKKVTRNDAAHGLRSVYPGTRQADELRAACEASARGARSVPIAHPSLVTSLTTFTDRPQESMAPGYQPNTASSPSTSSGSNVVQGLATVAAIALLILGAGYIASKGGDVNSLLDDDEPAKQPDAVQTVVSTKRGSVGDVVQESGGRVVYNRDTGTRYQVDGDTIKGSDGTSYKIRGTQIISSTGETYERIGSTRLRSSSGRECQLLSSSINCD